VEALSHVLVAAGCTTDPWMIKDVLHSKFCDRVSTLVDLTIRLNQALGEEITSGDLEVVWVPCGIPFDLATMDDINEHNTARRRQQQTSGSVLCTTELGLQRLVRTATKGHERSWDTTTLLKTKVALVSVTEGMATYDIGDR
jgi:hypothetical protein